jgi:glycosyltransferase involved in cell wall biosynthesis
MPMNNAGPLKICLLSYRSNPHSGGQGVYIKNLSRALTEMGHQVDVVSGPPKLTLDKNINIFRLPCLDLYNPDDLFRVPSLRELADPINFLEWMGVSTMGFPEPFTFGLRVYRFLKGRFSNYDIVHDNQCLSYGLWAVMKHIPTIATIHHPITKDRKLAIQSAGTPWKKLKQARWYSFVGMQKRVSLKLSRIITVSECAKKDICEDFGLAGSRIKVVPNGIRTDLFYPLDGIKKDKTRLIVTNSADVPLKGLDYLMKAVAQVSKTNNVSLTVVGTPTRNGKIHRLVRELGIRKLVTFTGRIDHDEFLGQYSKSSIAIVPSIYEGFGLPAGEAMACSLPVISTTGGALPEVVGNAGILVPPADSDALARAIKDLLDDPEKSKKLGEAGFRRVKQFFTWEKAGQRTVDAYREAIVDYRRLHQIEH